MILWKIHLKISFFFILFYNINNNLNKYFIISIILFNMNNIDYYKNKKKSFVIEFLKYYNIYNEGNFTSLDIKKLICLLIVDKKKKVLNSILKEIFNNYKYDRDYEFDEYFKYDNNFIIKLLTYYKYNISISKKDFKLLLIKEKEDKSNSIINFNIINEFYDEPGKDPNETTTPLHLACYLRLKNVVKLLIKYGANINIKNNKGESPLFIVCHPYFINLLKYLLNIKNNVNTVDNLGNTILHYVCLWYDDDSEEMLNYIIQCGADMNKTNYEGETPLMYSCVNSRNNKYISILVENAADVHKTNNKGETAFLLACKYGNETMINELIKYGVDINKADNDGNTPIYVAIHGGVCVYFLEYLVNLGVDLNKPNNKGRIPLHKLGGWNEKLYELFIERGSDVNKKDNEGITPLMIARKRKNEIAINCLIKHGAK